MHTGMGGCAYRGGGMCIQGWGDVHLCLRSCMSTETSVLFEIVLFERLPSRY